MTRMIIAISLLLFVRHVHWLISIYKMNYQSDIVNFLLGAYWGGGGALIGEGRSFRKSYFLDI